MKDLLPPQDVEINDPFFSLHTLHQNVIDLVPAQLAGTAFDHIARIRNLAEQFRRDLCL